jgi:hypothetical protein
VRLAICNNVGKMLVQCTTEGDIQHLRAATDRQDGKVERHGAANKCEF